MLYNCTAVHSLVTITHKFTSSDFFFFFFLLKVDCIITASTHQHIHRVKERKKEDLPVVAGDECHDGLTVRRAASL